MDATINQPYILMAVIYGGLIIGILYDIFRFFRRRMTAQTAWKYIFDGLFLVGAFFCLQGVLYFAADLQIRFYHYLGTLAGAALYLCGISPVIRLIYKKFKELTVDKIQKKRSNKK